MNLLGAKLYDPAAAVSKATSALLAMTAFDTTNLRLAVTVPAHGIVRFKIRCIITGATTAPTVLLGVLNGSTVVGRVAPLYENATANAASQNFALDAEFTVTGLTPGATNFDAAYAVQVVVAATNIKYGGPNTNGGANAWGGFMFEAWDPQPLKPALDGGVNVTQVGGTVQTAGDIMADTNDIQARLPAALVGGRIDSSVGAIAANAITAAAINADAITDAKVASDVTIASVTGSVGSVTGAVGSVTGNVGGNVTGSVGSVATGGITAGSIAADAIGASELAADAITEIQAGLATAAALTVVDDFLDTEIAAIKAKTDQLTFTTANQIDARVMTNSDKTGYSLTTAPLDAAGTRSALGLASANLDTQLTAIDDFLDTEVAAIKAKTDNLPAAPAATGDAMTLTSGERTSIATAVWASGTRTLSSFGTLVADVAAAVWAAATRTLSAFGFTVPTTANATETAIKAVTDKIDTALELDGAVYRYTTNALEQAPAGGGGSGLDAAGVRAAVGLASPNLDTQLGNVPTNAELATALSPTATKVDEIHKIQGLDAANPMTVTATARTAGAVELEITGDGVTTATVTRQ